ncbi:hypothetical protein, partial [Shigella sp. FC1567]|uniref:hypothetical protein n=1 Tax=Shigella sp. FC1567 TaxID=1898037 RepID=UPI001A7E8136
PQNPLRVFAPRSPKKNRAATVPVALKARPETVWGEPQTPIAATPTVYDHLPTAWLPVPCKWALQGAGAVPGDLKAPG